MAKDVTGATRWRFDALNDAEGRANVGVTGVVHDTIPLYVRRITIVTLGTGGIVTILEKTGGRTVVSTPTLDPQSTYVEEINGWFEGLRVTTFAATGAQIYIDHGVDPLHGC